MKPGKKIIAGLLMATMLGILVAACGGGSSGSAGSSTGGSSGGTFVPPPVRNIAYVAGGDGYVYQYTVASGILTPMTTSMVAGISPYSIALHPTQSYVYVANAAIVNGITQYDVNPDGSLTPMAASTVQTSGQIGLPLTLTLGPGGSHAYLPMTYSNEVIQFNIDASGVMSPMAASIVAAGSYPVATAIHPSGKYAYVAEALCNPALVMQFNVDASGALTPMAASQVSTGAMCPMGIAVDSKGLHAYVADYGGSGSLTQYNINTDGTLSPMAASLVAAAPGAESIAINPDGKSLYVANLISNNVTQYTINTDGSLTPMAASAVAVPYPSYITVDPTGKYAYVTSLPLPGPKGTTPPPPAVYQLTVGADGSLTPMAASQVQAGTAPRSIVVY